MRTCKVKDRNKPWISNEILQMMYTRDYLHKQAVKMKDFEIYAKYKSLRNKITGEISRLKQEFFSKQIEESTNSPSQI